jgi:hypothetical protein
MIARLSIAAAGVALALTSAGAAGRAPDMAGSYTCKGACQTTNGEAVIQQWGTDIRCINEVGDTVDGHITGPRSLTCWGLNARISGDGAVITWGNGTRWVR